MHFSRIIRMAVLMAIVPSANVVAAQQTHQMKFDRVEAELPMGEVFLKGKRGMLCIPHEAHTWDQAKAWLKRDMFERSFHEVALANGLPIAGDPTSMFGDSGFQDADLLVGASFKRFMIDACAPLSTNKIKGSSTLEIEWQVYSKREGRLIYRGYTRAQYKLDKPQDGGLFRLVLAPFEDSVRQLAQKAELRAAIMSAR